MMEAKIMVVHVLFHYYDTPDVEGYEILGVYRDIDDARADMSAAAAVICAEFPNDVWDNDMTWYKDNEIHLGFDNTGVSIATIYCWGIVTREVQ